MYDSDEVRDAVRRDAAEFYRQRSLGILSGEPGPPLSPAEQGAIDDMLSAWGNPWQRALREYLAALDAATGQAHEELLAWAQVAVTKFLSQLSEVARVMCERLRQLGEAIVDGIVGGISGSFQDLADAYFGPTAAPPRFHWQRRPRRPDVRPARPIDPVAAGRHPAAIFRTRIRGGRR